MAINKTKLRNHLLDLVKEFNYSCTEDELIDIGWEMFCEAKVEFNELELSILECLYLLDFMTMDQLRVLFFQNLSHSGCLHYLDKFRTHGLIYNDLFGAKASRTVIWHLTRLGVKWFLHGKGNGDSIPDIKRAKQSQLQHDIAVNQIFVDLAEMHGGFDKLTDMIDWYPFFKRCLKYNPVEKTDPKRSRTYTFYDMIHPDAVLETFQSKAKVFIEYETGTKSSDDIARNLAKYARYYATTKDHYDRVHVLLYVVKDENIKAIVQNEAEKLQKQDKLVNFRICMNGRETIDKLNVIIRGPDGTTKEQPNK